MNIPSLNAPADIIKSYLKTLKVGEKVIEYGKTCMEGCTGTIYRSPEHGLCVMWDTEVGPMGTGVTFGTRRIKDKLPN